MSFVTYAGSPPTTNDNGNDTYGSNVPFPVDPDIGSGQVPVTSSSSFCSGQIKTLTDLINFFVCILLKSVVPLLFTVSLIVFIYGVVKYIMHADDEKEREEGRKFMLFGIIALFVMVSVWGLVQVLRNTFGLDTFIPQLQT